ncbi:restriction endonuclease [Siccirubricoccus deserti]
MTGLAFERATADAFRHLGWEVEQTRASGDYGADVIARFGTTSIVIQCKDWKGPAGLAAVQEVFFARKHYRANLAMVVARSGFTRQAQKAAESTEVRLVRLSDLRRHCEFDRSVEAARAQREREARETARRDRELAEARERLAREEAETRERLAREEAKARERHAQKVREAKRTKPRQQGSRRRQRGAPLPGSPSCLAAIRRCGRFIRTKEHSLCAPLGGLAAAYDPGNPIRRQ